MNGAPPVDEAHVSRELLIHGFYGRPWLPIQKLFEQEKRNQQILKDQLEAVQPDLVFVWNMGGISKALLHTLEAGDIPVVYDVSDHWIARSFKGDVWLSWWNDPGSAGRNLLRLLLRLSGLAGYIGKSVPTADYRSLRFQRIYFCSQFMRQLTADQGYPVAHGEIIYCGVETQRFAVKSSYGEAGKFLWVGRLAEDKDPLTAVEGLARLMERLSESGFQLDIYGRGEDAYVAMLRQRIEELGMQEKVQLKSASHDEMKSIYSRYDALLFTSNWGEPFALTPLEAMASGLSVIMCPDGGDAELARDGDNAIVFEAGNPSSLAEAMERFCQLPEGGKEMALRALEEVRNRYDLAVIVDQIERYLEETLKA